MNKKKSYMNLVGWPLFLFITYPAFFTAVPSAHFSIYILLNGYAESLLMS